jgi:UDP-GlcNAc:undecaprenyl-phosphate GlcNAc-1-phosphate transferase
MIAQNEVLPLVGIAGLAFGLALVLTPMAIWLGLKTGAAAVPGGRRTHTRTTSKLGVLPLAGAFTIAAIAAQFLNIPTTDPNEKTRFYGLMLSSFFIFLVALLDDKFELAGLPQFAAQFVAAVISVFFLVFIERFRNPFTNLEEVLPPILAALVTLFWFMGMMNTVNWLDGVDGLAAMVSLIAAVMIAIHMLREGQTSVALLPMALIGALAGFLVFNLPQAKIFLGGGALYLGYALAALGIIGGAKIALVLLVMGLPIADVAWQIIDRALHGRNPAQGDRGHLHFRLQDMGWNAKKIVLTYSLVCIGFGLIALSTQPAYFKLLMLGGLAVFVLAALIFLSRKKN